MKERPIMLYTNEILAINDGRQTRIQRVITPQPPGSTVLRGPEMYVPAVIRGGQTVPGRPVWGVADGEWGAKCPFRPGDVLWVQEPWQMTVTARGKCCVAYMADMSARAMLCDNEGEGDPVDIGEPCVPYLPSDIKWRSPARMPRWASRTNLKVISVVAERMPHNDEPDGTAHWVVTIERKSDR